MNCLICNSPEKEIILSKESISIWLGTEDNKPPRQSFKCCLIQCTKCGHVQQEISNELKHFLNSVYSSSYAQVSIPLGKGNWGVALAKRIIDNFDLKNQRSALEIGCADGYILQYLKSKGFVSLVGIEPSLKESGLIDDITYVKEYANSMLNLKKKFDLILAFNVFEHILDINGMMKFICNHLEEGGELWFNIPNDEIGFKEGDPGVFLHEHIHYYTLNSIYRLMANYKLRVKGVKTERDGHFVYADLNGSPNFFDTKPSLYNDYEKKLVKNLQRIKDIAGKSIVFHGVCNTLNNILGWVSEIKDFYLLDNDQTKTNKIYFGQIVRLPAKETIEDRTSIIITSSSFYNDIKEQYLQLGFDGKIYGTVFSE